MNRKEKINLLKDIAKGTKSIEDLTPITDFNIWFVDDRILTNEKTGEVLTSEEYEARYKNTPKIIFK